MNAELQEALVSALREARSAHQVETIQGGVGQCWECGEVLRVEYGDDGQPLFNPFIEHHLKVQADAALRLFAEALAPIEALAEEHARTVTPAPYTSERALIERLQSALAALGEWGAA